MAQIFWEQIRDILPSAGKNLTGSLSVSGSVGVSGSIVLNGIDLGLIDAGIFRQTGSFYSTTNDLEITGSMKLSLDGVSDYFSVSVGGVEQLRVNEEGILVLSAQGTTPSAVTGGIFYSSSDAYFLGFTDWKRIIVSGSDAQLNSLIVANSVTASSLTVSGSITGADYIDFSTVSTVPYNEGRLFYDQENGALAFYNEEADITLQIGQEFYKRVSNRSGALITNGTPVRISGSQGDVPNIYPAFSTDIYSGSYNARENKIIGLATHDIENNSLGYVTEFGIVRGINTTAFAAGDVLYLQTGSAGFRNTPPPFPFDIIPVGEVVRRQSNGFIEVRTAEPITSENISGIINIETEVISDESITILKGTPVHVVSEGSGPVPRVKIAKSSDSNLMPATFVVEEDIISGSQGTALSTGYIFNVDTSAFAVGDTIFVAPNGGYTNVKPTGSNLIQNLGVVLKVDATQGSGFVYGSGRSNDVPNIPENYLWIGNADGVATPVSTGSLSGSFLLNTTDTFTGDLTVSGSILPENELYDLGSPTQRWKDLYLSGSTIYLGNTTISETSWTEVSSSVAASTASYATFAQSTADRLSTIVTLTPSDLLSFAGGNQIEILPSSSIGPNQTYLPYEYTMYLDYSTTPYNFNIPIALGYSTVDANHTADYFFLVDNGQLNGTADVTRFIYNPTTPFLKHQSIVLDSRSGTTVTQGDSIVKLQIFYKIIDIIF